MYIIRKDFLLSIVIPTKNREKYALATVEQILSIKDERIQIVVQDNSDTLVLFELLKNKIDNTRVKYNHTKGIVSFVNNFNLAVDQADGEYLCMIGDDDGILPQIVEVANWAKYNDIDAIKPELNVVYFWPDSGARRDKADNGFLSIKKPTTAVNLCTPEKEVKKLMKQGAQDYLNLDLVKLYHGLVKRECLENIKRKVGRYFSGLSPDIYISVALSLTIEKMVKLDFPLTISGICNKSGSSDSATGKHTGELSDAPHFRGHENYNWSELVPPFYSVNTIWADSALAAVHDLDRKDLEEIFNIEYLTINSLLKFPEFKETVLEFYKDYYKIEKKISIIKSWTFLEHVLFKAIRKIKRKIYRDEKGNFNTNNVKNILEASLIAQKKLLLENISTEEIIDSLNGLK